MLLGGGPLKAQFERIGNVVSFSDPPWREQANAEVMRARQQEIKRLFAEGARHAICNTSASGYVVRMLKEEGFQVIALIHELPNLIREFQLEPSAKEIGRWADRVVFPAAFVRDRFLPIAELDPARAVVRPQGLYRPNPYRNAKNEARAQLLANLGLAPKCLCGSRSRSGRPAQGRRHLLPSGSACGPGRPRRTFRLARRRHHDVRGGLQGVGPDNGSRAQRSLRRGNSRSGRLSTIYRGGRSVSDDFAGRPLSERGSGGHGCASARSRVCRRRRIHRAPGSRCRRVDTLRKSRRDGGCGRSAARGSRCGDTNGRAGQRTIDMRFKFLDYAYDLVALVGCPRHKISVVVPNYNYAHFLPTRLETIIAQTYRPYEIIFLDDNSTDDSVAVAEAILSKSGLPYRILVNDVNRGCYSQWLHGIEQTAGDLLWIAEADDESEPTFLEELVQGFEEPDVVLAFSQSRKIDQEGKLIRGDYCDYTDDVSRTKWRSAYHRDGRDEILDALAIKNTIPNASGVLMKKPDLSAIRQQLLTMRNAGDWLSYVHILASGSIYFTPRVLNSHRVHLGGATRGGNALRHMCEIVQVQEYVRALYELTPDTTTKIEAMRQFTYEYLGLDADGVRSYRDHPALQQILAGGKALPADPVDPDRLSRIA